MPVIRGRCWENAARRSFFSRDNMENFIQFCRRLGIHENLLFESDDLGNFYLVQLSLYKPEYNFLIFDYNFFIYYIYNK